MSRVKYQHNRSGKLFKDINQDDSDIKEQNARLKKQLKEITSQKNIVIKQCTQLSTRLDALEQQKIINGKRHNEQMNRHSNEGYRIQELHFLNKELNNQIEQLRRQNKQLLEKYKRTTNVVEMKYEQLERNTFKKIEQAMKRVKKAVMYLTTLSTQEIQKTKSSIVQSLEKSLQLLKGKGLGQTYEQEVEELMSPITAIKEQLQKKDKQLRSTKLMLQQIQQSYNREEKLNKNILPQYKISIQQLQKNLTIARSQVAQLEIERLENRRKYQIKIKDLEEENRQLVTAFTKLKLERKLYSDRIRQIEGEAEEEKQRLIDQNQMLKALYNTKPTQLRVNSAASSHFMEKKGQSRKESLSRSQNSSRSRLSESKYSQKYSDKFSQRDSSLMSSVYQSQNINIKNQIQQVDRQINQIQMTLMRELEGHRSR